MVGVVVSSPACIDGIATLTMVTSSSAMKPTTRVTPRIRQRCGCGAACCRPGSASVEVTPPGYPTADRRGALSTAHRVMILPGLRLRPGSTAVEQPVDHGHAGGRRCPGPASGECSVPTAWWCDSVPPWSTKLCWMADFTTSYWASGSSPSEPEGEGEVQAGAGVVGVRQVAHDPALDADLVERPVGRGDGVVVELHQPRPRGGGLRHVAGRRRGRAGSPAGTGCRTSSGRRADPDPCRPRCRRAWPTMP